MTDKLSEDDRLGLVQYRLQRSESSLNEADYLAKGGFFNAAVNRLYYAAYYALTALLLKDGYDVGTHAGARTMLSLKYIRTDMLPVKYGRIYGDLFNFRQSGDYDDFVYYDIDSYSAMKPQTEDFIAALKALI